MILKVLPDGTLVMPYNRGISTECGEDCRCYTEKSPRCILGLDWAGICEEELGSDYLFKEVSPETLIKAKELSMGSKSEEDIIKEMMGLLSPTKGEVDAVAKLAEGNKAFSAVVSEADAVLQAEKKAEEALKAAELLKKEIAKKKKEEEEEAIRQQELKDKGYIFLSSITNGRLPKSKIDHEIYVYPKGTWSEEHEVNIPEVDPHYYWDADLLEMMVLCIKMGERGLLVGMPGTGKTSATKQLAAHLRQPFARFNGKEGVEPSSFLGYAWADQEIFEHTDGTKTVTPVMTFKEGLMPQAVREGYLTVIDEVMKMPPGVQMALQSLYEKGGFLMLDDKPGTIADKHIKPKASFLLFCTDNSCGTGDNLDLFAASQLQDTSTLDRFGFTYEVEYLPMSEEVKMLQGVHKGIRKSDVADLVSLAGLVRNAFKTSEMPVTLSPRGLMTMCGAIQLGLSWEHAIKIVFGNKLGEDHHVAKLDEFLNTVR